MTAATMLDVGALAELACLLEVSAPKPGNVRPGRSFADTRFEDFLVSAMAIRDPLAAAATRPLGTTIRLAIDATSRWTASNTNLGLVLLLAPLACAAATSTTTDLRASLARVLDTTTVADARDVYAAIRRANPGGLGSAPDQDVATEPTVTLRDAMALAADRDSIAREYTTRFAITFETGAPALVRARADGLSWDDAIVETFVTILAMVPDTHVARRAGAELADAVSTRARDVLNAGGVRSNDGRRALDAFDGSLRDDTNRANPGTTADLTGAAIFVVLTAGGWSEHRSRR